MAAARRLFEPLSENFSPRAKRIHAICEIAYTVVEFLAAVAFIIGSVMFFSPAWLLPGTWLFLVGSVLFAVKPTIRLLKELMLAAEGQVDKIS